MDATPLPVEDSAALYDADLSPRNMTDSENSMPLFEPPDGATPMAVGTDASLARVDENATDTADVEDDADDADAAPEPVEAWTPSIPSKMPATVSAAAPAAGALPVSAMFDDVPAAAAAAAAELATTDRGDGDKNAPPPLDDAPPLHPTDSATPAADAAAITEDPPLDDAPTIAMETEAAGTTASATATATATTPATETVTATETATATASPNQQKRSALEDSDSSDSDTDDDAEDGDVAATAAEDGDVAATAAEKAPADGDAAYAPPGTEAATRSPSERQQAKQKAPKGPTEKQRAKKRREMEIETSKFMRDSSNCTISMKACANPDKQRTVEHVLAFAQPSLPSRSRSRSNSGSVDGTKATEATIKKPVFKQKRALLQRLKSEGALDTAPKLGRGLGVRLGKKVDHHKMLADGKQIELAPSFSPRKLKKLHSAEEYQANKPKLSAAALWRQARHHAKQSLAEMQRAKIAADIALHKEDEEDYEHIAEEEMAPDGDENGENDDDNDGEGEKSGEDDDELMADGEDNDSELDEAGEAGEAVATDGAGKADAAQLQEMFNVFDKDGIGTISSTELRQAISDLGMTVTDEEADRMISNADGDGDGNIDFAEFSKILSVSAGPDATDADTEAELDVLNAETPDPEPAKPPPAKPVAKAFSAMDFFSKAKITATAPQRAPPSLRPTTPVMRPGTPVMGTPNGRVTPDLFESTPKHLSQHAPDVTKPKTAMLPAGQNIDAIQMSGCNTPQSIAAGQNTIRDTPNDDSQSLQSLQIARNSESSMMGDEQSQYLDANGLVAHRAASDGKRAAFAPRKLDTSAGSSVATKPVTTEMTATQAEDMDDLAELCSGVFPDADEDDDEEEEAGESLEETEETTGSAAGYFLEEAEVDSDDSEYEGVQEDEETEEALIDDGEPVNGSDEEADMQKMQMQELAEDGETPAFLKKYMVEKDSDDSDDEERGAKRKAENDDVEEVEEKELTKEEQRALRKEKKRAKKERKERRRKRRAEREAEEKKMAEENSQMDMFDDDDAPTSAAALDEPDASDDDEDNTRWAARQDERQQWMASRAKEDSQMELSLMDESSQQIQAMIKRTSSSRTSSTSQQVASAAAVNLTAAAANPTAAAAHAKPAGAPNRPFAAFGGSGGLRRKSSADGQKPPRRGSFLARRSDPNVKLLSGSGIGKSKSGKSNQGYAFKVTSRDSFGDNGDSQPSESSKPKSGFGPSAFSGIGQKSSKASDALMSKAPKRPALASLGQGGKSGSPRPKSAFAKRSSVLMKAISSKPRK